MTNQDSSAREAEINKTFERLGLSADSESDSASTYTSPSSGADQGFLTLRLSNSSQRVAA